MEVTGKIIVALPEVGGTSQKGNPWKKREYVLETQETYPRTVFFKVSSDIDSREYNGRWFVEIRAWKAEDASAAPAPGAPAAYGAPASYGPAPQMPQGYAAPAAAPAPPVPDLTPSATDDLPF